MNLCSTLEYKNKEIIWIESMPHTLNVGSYFHICNQISYIGYYVWIQNDSFEIQIVDKIEKHMRYDSAWAYLELFLSTTIFEFDLIWFAVVFDSLSDWREREREYSQFFCGKNMDWMRELVSNLHNIK